MLEKLAKQTAIYGISTIVGRFLSYLLTPFYTRVFGTDSYGIVTDVYALIPFALVLLTMGMESSYFRFAAKAETLESGVEEQKRRIFATTWGITSLAAVIFFVLISLFCPTISRLMGPCYELHPEYVTIVGAIVMLDVIACLPFSRLREQGKALKFVMLKLLNIIMQVILAVVFWMVGLYDTEFGVGWVLVANLLASVATTLTVIFFSDRVLPRISWTILSAILVYSLPLLVSGVAGTANEFIDRQMIKYLLPVDAMSQLGIYGAITKIAVVMTLFTQMYRLAAEPFFLSNFKKEDFLEMNAAALKYYMMVSMAIFLGIALFKDLFALIVGPSFREGIYILPVVLGANVLSGVWLNLSFWYKREEKTRYAMYVTFIGLGATVLGSILLIPRYGYFGAAWGRLAAEAVMVLVSYYLNRRYFPTPYDISRIFQYVVLALVIFLLSTYVGERVESMWMVAVNSCLLLLYAMYAVRRENIDLSGLVRAAKGKLGRR